MSGSTRGDQVMLQGYRPRRRADEPVDAETLLSVLDDADCRAFLRALSDPRTVAELCRRCDVPSSTTYRKLDRLADAGLVESTVEVRNDGNHRKRFSRTVDAVTFTLDGDVRLGND